MKGTYTVPAFPGDSHEGKTKSGLVGPRVVQASTPGASGASGLT